MDILSDGTYKQYNRISRYSQDLYYYNKLDDKYMYGSSHKLSDDTSYTVHKVKYGDTFDSLALEYYGNPTYFWIICDFNRINDPFMSLTEYSTIKIPSISTIEFEVYD